MIFNEPSLNLRLLICVNNIVLFFLEVHYCIQNYMTRIWSWKESTMAHKKGDETA